VNEEFTISTISDISEIEKIPVTERVRERSTFELIEKGASYNPDAAAITFLMNGNIDEEPVIIPYKNLLGKIRQAANMFNDLGAGPEDVITYLLPNIPQSHFILWGAETAGIVNPINPMLEPETIRDICNAAGTKILVSIGSVPGSDVWEKVDSIRKDIPSLKCVVRVMGPSDKDNNIFGFEEELGKYSSEKLTFEREIDPDDIASLYHTGGTTGRPKLARRTHYNEIVGAWDIKVTTGSQPGDGVMVGMPLFHCNGTMATGLVPFSSGGNVIMLSPSGYRNPTIMKNFYKIIERYKPVWFSAVPTILTVLMNLPIDDADISSLKFAVSGAAPLSVEVFNRFEKYTNMRLIESYGLTEQSVCSSANPKDGEPRIGSVGFRMPYHDTKIVIMDKDGEYVRDADTNEIGVITIGGPCTFKGYVEEIHNRGIWLPNGFFNTGDMGRIDEDGYLWITGRQKDLIIRGGHNIDPSIIEESLYQLNGIKYAAAVGRPDTYAGEVPVAYVELDNNAELTKESIMEWAKKKIGERAAIPKDIYIIDDMPLSAIGKILKPVLRRETVKRQFTEELKGMNDLAEKVEVEVSEDKVHGIKAEIRINCAAGVDREKVKARAVELLANYAVFSSIIAE